MAHGDVPERTRQGSVDLHGRADDRVRRLEKVYVRPLVLHPALRRLAARYDVARLADLESGNGARQRLVERVVYVHRRGGVVRRLLERLREVDCARLAVRADDLDEDDLALSVPERVVERYGRQRAASLLGERLDPFLVRGDVCSVRLVDRLDAVVDYDGVRVWIPLGRQFICGSPGSAQQRQAGDDSARHAVHLSRRRGCRRRGRARAGTRRSRRSSRGRSASRRCACSRSRTTR